MGGVWGDQGRAAVADATILTLLGAAASTGFGAVVRAATVVGSVAALMGTVGAVAGCGADDGSRTGGASPVPTSQVPTSPGSTSPGSPSSGAPASTSLPGATSPAGAEPIPAAAPTDINPLLTQVGGTVDAATIAGQPAIFVTPPGGPTSGRAVIYAHGASQRADAIANPGGVGDGLVPALIAAGYSVAATDAHGDNWGNDASLTDYAAVRAELARRGAKQFFVLAASMGGLDGLRLTAGVEAFAGIYPVCDLSTMLDGPLGAAVSNAWGGAVPTALSPVQTAEPNGLPMLFWASPGDTLVHKATNTDRCAADARAAGASVEVVTTAGDHGDPTNFDPARLVAFFDEAARD